MQPTACEVVITGRVQGVFFRVETQKAAQSLQVAGYVKNMPDGSVKALFQGDKEAVERMLQWCHTGAPLSRVDDVRVSQVPFQEGLDQMEIRY